MRIKDLLVFKHMIYDYILTRIILYRRICNRASLIGPREVYTTFAYLKHIEFYYYIKRQCLFVCPQKSQQLLDRLF